MTGLPVNSTMNGDTNLSMTSRKSILAAVILAAVMFLSHGNAARAGERIVLLVSANDAPFKETLAGFSEYLAHQGIQSGFEVVNLDGDAGKAGPAIQKIKSGGTRLVLTLGSLATDAAVRQISDIPIVACLVLRTEGLKNTRNATGVGLEFPLETQIERLRQILPNARTIGVIYNPDENQRRVDAAAEIAKKAGLRIEAYAIRSPQEIPAALNMLSRRVDVLWGIPDSITLSPLMAKNVLLFSLRNSIPFVGPSAAWVKAGALYSLDGDYADLGAQCGEIATRVLQGTAPESIPAVAPRKVQYSLNLNTARQMKLLLTDQLVSGARQTY